MKTWEFADDVQRGKSPPLSPRRVIFEIPKKGGQGTGKENNPFLLRLSFSLFVRLLRFPRDEIRKSYTRPVSRRPPEEKKEALQWHWNFLSAILLFFCCQTAAAKTGGWTWQKKPCPCAGGLERTNLGMGKKCGESLFLPLAFVYELSKQNTLQYCSKIET